MTNRIENLQHKMVSLFGAFITAALFISAAVPIVPVA